MKAISEILFLVRDIDLTDHVDTCIWICPRYKCIDKTNMSVKFKKNLWRNTLHDHADKQYPVKFYFRNSDLTFDWSWRCIQTCRRYGQGKHVCEILKFHQNLWRNVAYVNKWILCGSFTIHFLSRGGGGLMKFTHFQLRFQNKIQWECRFIMGTVHVYS